MTKRQAEGSVIPGDFGYAKHPELMIWMQREFPQLDAEQTMTRFVEYAEDSGRIATIWTACFKRVVRTGIDNGWKGICVFKEGKAGDPQWKPVLALAKEYGFRAPLAHETPAVYRTDLQMWISREHRKPIDNPVIDFSSALKKMA